MKLVAALVLSVIQVALVEALREESGYLRGSVTLRSGAHPSWNLTNIVWSILKNNTWIATYNNQEVNTEWLARYQGRLKLNTTSGDLTISNLNMKDQMVYNVDVISATGQDNSISVHLKVNQPLKNPTIQMMANPISADGGCWLMLTCSSMDKDVHFSWQVTNASMPFFRSESSVVFAFINNTQNLASFTCTSSRGTQSSSTTIKRKCEDVNSPPQGRCRHAGLVFIGFFLGILVFVVIYFIRGKFVNQNKTKSGTSCGDNAQ